MMKNLLTTFSLLILLSVGWSQCKKCFEELKADPNSNNACIIELEFIFDKAIYLPEFQASIDSLAALLKTYPNFIVEIGNHRDSRGSDMYGTNITQRRAMAVADSLVARGVPKEKVVARGYGEEVPRKLDNDYTGKISGYVFPRGTVLTEDYINSLGSTWIMEDAHTLNRRTEIKVISIR